MKMGYFHGNDGEYDDSPWVPAGSGRPQELERLVITRNRRSLPHFGALVVLLLAALVLAACGSSAQSTEAGPVSPPAMSDGEPGSAGLSESEPEGMIAPKFTLPSAAGDSVSLDSFAGDKNVVLVFYRGFW